MNDYNSIKTYWESFAGKGGIATVVFGDIDELLDGLKGKAPADYPLMFVPIHEREPEENAADYRYERLDFIVTLYRPYNPQKGKAERHQILADLEPIINRIVAKVVNDIEEEDESEFPLSEYIDFKVRGPNVSEPLGPSNLIGYAFELEILINSPIQHDPAAWL